MAHMNAKSKLSVIAAAVFAIILSTFAVLSQEAQPRDGDVLFQASTLHSLLIGSYDGRITVQELLAWGDFGLGAIEYMDGELVCLEATCYRIDTSGKAYALPPESKVAFATVVFFREDEIHQIGELSSFANVQDYLDNSYIERDSVFAIRMDGFFNEITVRSVPKQDEPYVPLSEVISSQAVFHISDVRGVLVGFYIPEYVGEVNVAGYHFHFITEDREFGGHVLEMDMANGTAKISKISQIHLIP